MTGYGGSLTIGASRRKSLTLKYEAIYRTDRLPSGAEDSGGPLLADNYILFTNPPDRAYISPNPPEVAIAVKGYHEEWSIGDCEHSLLVRQRHFSRAAGLPEGGE